MNTLSIELQRDREGYLLRHNWGLRNMSKKALFIIFLILLFTIMPKSLWAFRDGPKPDLVISSVRGYKVKKIYWVCVNIKNIGQGTAYNVTGNYSHQDPHLLYLMLPSPFWENENRYIPPGGSYYYYLQFNSEPHRFRCSVSARNEPEELKGNNSWSGDIQFKKAKHPPACPSPPVPLPPASLPPATLPPAALPPAASSQPIPKNDHGIASNEDIKIFDYRIIEETNSKIVLAVDYWYSGRHSNGAILGVYVYPPEESPCGNRPVRLQPGRHTATPEVNCLIFPENPPTMVSDKLMIRVYTIYGMGRSRHSKYLYTKTFPYPKTWRKRHY